MVNFLVGLFFFLFGLCVGSFLNVVVYRLNHNLSPLRGRSFCPKCKKKIPWRDNIPLFSFILLRGRCRFCHSPISWQYPLVELATSILTLLTIYFSSLYLDAGWFEISFYLLITYALIALFVSDFRYQTIPDEIVYSAMVLALLFGIIGGIDLVKGLVAGVVGAAFFGILVLATRGRGMGMGDVKLVGFMGLFLGFPKIAIALMTAFLTGALVGVILVLIGKKRFGEHIPFGPFLTSATWVSFFWGQIIWQFYVEKVLV